MLERALTVVSLLLAACGDAPGAAPPPSTPVITVRFEYPAATAIDPQVREEHGPCTEAVGITHIHPSWQNYQVVRMSPERADLWSRTFADVPLGGNKIRVSDPNACRTDSLGAVTAHVITANGTLLTREVETPGEGPEPGFAFVANADGTIGP